MLPPPSVPEPAPHRAAPQRRARRVRRSTLAAATTIALLIVLSGCAGSSDGDAGASEGGTTPTIVVTTTILGDLVNQVVGDDADVEVLIPPGADPHDYEPSAAQAARVRDADLVVANGLGLEARLLDTLEAAEDEGVRVLEVAPQLDPQPFATTEDADHDHDHDEEAEDVSNEHDHEGDDPHVWLDPDRMAEAAGLVAGEIADATGLDRATLDERAANYASSARAAAEEADRLLAVVPADQRVLVTNHDALGYFARRFGLEVVGVAIPGGSTLAEPSAAEIAELAELVRSEGVRAVFSETIVPPRVLDALAREAGSQVAVVELYTDSLGEPGSPAATYAGMIVEDAKRVADGLTGRG
jgi:zinc/manganese transport system substrate-binding protein